MKISLVAQFIILCLLSLPFQSSAEMLDVLIKGMDNGIKTNRQQDYKEALMNSKLEAIERAGVDISSITKIVDGKLKYDIIESKAKAVLMPGFKVMDMGYQTDGTYQVVLVGKVKTARDGIENKQLRYAKSLIERGKNNEAKKIVNNIIEISKDDNAVAEALYCKIVWKFTYDENEVYERLAAFYPDSKYTKIIKVYLDIKKNNNREFGIHFRGKLSKDSKYPSKNKKLYVAHLGYGSYSKSDLKVNLIDKHKKVYTLTVKAWGTGYKYYQKKVLSDYKYTITYKLYMNNKYLTTLTNKVDSKVKYGGFAGPKVLRGESPKYENVPQEIVEYPVRIQIRDDRKEQRFKLILETLPDALPILK